MTKDEAREAALLAACGLEPDHGTFGAECRFSRTVVDYMFDAGYDFAKSEDRWIVVEIEGPPTIGGPYITTQDIFDDGELMSWPLHYNATDDQWYDDIDNTDVFTGKVIAWRPLPEPYKEAK